MNYATGCAFNSDQIFMNFPYDKLLVTCNDCNVLNGDYHKDKLVKRVFLKTLQLIINDIIDNNVTFQLPVSGRQVEMHMDNVQGKQFQKARKNGKFLDVDFLNSNFTGNQIVFDMYYKNGGVRRRKPIYLNPTLRDKITTNTNNGKQYC